MTMTMGGGAKTAAEKPLTNAVETGILKWDKVLPRLSDIRDKLESVAGVGVDLSIVKRGGSSIVAIFPDPVAQPILSNERRIVLLDPCRWSDGARRDGATRRRACRRERRAPRCRLRVGRTAVDDDYGDVEARIADRDDFLGWPILLEVMPFESAGRYDVVRAVVSLMNGLIGRGLRVLAQAEYANDLPGGGEIAPPMRISPSTR